MKGVQESYLTVCSRQTNKTQDPRLKTKSELILNKKAFCPAEICQYDIELSPNAIPIGLKIIDDETWNIPLLDSCIKDTEAYKQIVGRICTL